MTEQIAIKQIVAWHTVTRLQFDLIEPLIDPTTLRRDNVMKISANILNIHKINKSANNKNINLFIYL